MIFDQYATLAIRDVAPARRERAPLSLVPSSLNPASPALSVLQDFHLYPSAFVPDHLSLERAMELFLLLDWRYLLVENSAGEFQGILTADAVMGPQRLMLMRLHQALPRELSVRELLIPRDRLLSIPYSTLAHVCIGDVLHTLEVNGQPFLCVHDEDAGHSSRLRGLFCGRNIAERLGLPWSPSLRARNFSELRATLLGQADLASTDLAS